MHDLGVSSILSHKIHDYFSSHKDLSVIQDLYTLIMNEVERPLLETTLKAVQGNQKKAAAILGINRNTLRKKLLYHKVCFEQYR